MRPTDTVAALLWATALTLAALTPGCEPPDRGGDPAVSATWLAELPPAQSSELLRPVTPAPWPAAAPDHSTPFTVSVTTGHPGNLAFGGDQTTDLPVALTINVANARPGVERLARLSYTVLDLYGRRVAGAQVGELAVPRHGNATRTVTLTDLNDLGPYEVIARVDSDAGPMVARSAFAIVPLPDAAEKAVHRFACRGTLRAAPAAVRVGCRLCYVPNLIADGVGVANLDERRPDRHWTPGFDPSVFRFSLDAFQNAGLACVGQIGHGLDPQTRVIDADSVIPVGLPADPGQFARYTAPLVLMLPSVRIWDVLPDPLERLGASAAELRQYLTTQTDAIRSGRRDVELWASGRAGAANDYLTAPTTAGLLDGLRFLHCRDEAPLAAWVAGRAKAARWIAVLAERPPEASPQRRAWRAVKDVLGVLAAGGDVELPTQTLLDPHAAAALATLIQRVQAATFHGEVWPELPLVRSPVFDGPRRRVAVLWSDVTADADPNGPPDCGVLEIADARHLAAEDCMGRPIGMWRKRSLIVPIGPGPVTVLSDRLSAADLAARLRGARMVGIAPIALRAASITSPIGPRATVALDVVGLTPHTVRAELSVEGPRGWEPARAVKTVRVAPGRATRVELTFRNAARTVDNDYPLTLRATVGPWTTTRVQVVHQAVAPEATVTVDGRLDDWTDVPPLAMPVPRPAPAESAAHTQPNAPAGSAAVKVWTAHDSKTLYVAAEVPMATPLKRDRTVGPTGSAAMGNPWGPETIQLAFGRADDPQPAYVLALVPTAARPAVVRMHAPGMDRRNPLPDLPIKDWGEVPGARVAIVDAGDRAIYEAAIPREELAQLPWSRGRRWHVAVLVDLPGGATLQWAETADVFHWQSSRCTFFPLPRRCRAAVTQLGLVRAAGGR